LLLVYQEKISYLDLCLILQISGELIKTRSAMSTTGYANAHCSTTGVSVRGASRREAHRRYRSSYRGF
ncbi:MAG: hypothetical protein ACYTXY_49705, partial [Nostoc sp.]